MPEVNRVEGTAEESEALHKLSVMPIDISSSADCSLCNGVCSIFNSNGGFHGNAVPWPPGTSACLSDFALPRSRQRHRLRFRSAKKLRHSPGRVRCGLHPTTLWPVPEPVPINPPGVKACLPLVHARAATRVHSRAAKPVFVARA